MKRAVSICFALLLLFAVLPQASKGETVQSDTFEADRVLIYNPLPYAANANTLYSGTLSGPQQIEKADGESVFTPGRHVKGKDLSRAEKDPRTHDFWVLSDFSTYRYDKRTFTLAAEGEHCYIWTMVDDTLSFTPEQTADMLEAFETVIYESDTTHFGNFRDLDGDGKVHIVTYAMNSNSICGFFDTYDLYSREEIESIDPDEAESYNCLPIINVNSRLADLKQVVYCTLAHEFQHLILFSAALESPANADRIGRERCVDLWLNEGFSMAAEELAYPGAVAEQGYVDSYSESDKVRFGMSFQNFDALSNDVGAYGQSFLFTEYLRMQCGASACREILDYWRGETDNTDLTEARAIARLLSEVQISALDTLCAYTDPVTETLGEKENVLLSKFALAFRLAVLLKAEDGIFAFPDYDARIPVYTGSGKWIEGGGALLIECNGTYSVPKDASSGLVFAAIRDGEITNVYTVPEPEEGFYVIAAQYGERWYALPARPAQDGIIRPIEVMPNGDGTIDAENARGAVFTAVRSADGFRFFCDDANGTYALNRTGNTKQTLSVSETGDAFTWMHFAGGTDRLQADGYYGRAILYGGYQGGFGYFASGYFENESFAQPVLLRVNLLHGDANMDGRLSAADAAFILKTVVGLDYMNEPMRSVADMNGDGVITAEDAVSMLRRFVNLES